MKVEFYYSQNETKYASKLITKECGVINKGLEILHKTSVFISTFIVVVCLMVIFSNIQEVFCLFPAFIICLGMLLIGIGIYFLSKWFLVKKLTEKTRLPNEKFTFELLPDKIIHLTNNGLKLEILPIEIKKFFDIKGFFLMFVKDNFAFYIPPSAFPDETVRKEFKIKIEKLLGG